MSFTGGKSAVVKLDATAGGSLTDYSAYADSVDTSFPTDLGETTTFGKTARVRIATINDFSFSVEFRYDPVVMAVLSSHRGASQSCSFEIGPQGSTATMSKFTGECYLESFETKTAFDGIVMLTASFKGTDTTTITTY